ncbi:MAG: PSD1 domain-containing protein [Verrucomicrobiales bacterium]|nr:PSD1 domain-containing protein [Verrucomicrobiales bacterium]
MTVPKFSRKPISTAPTSILPPRFLASVLVLVGSALGLPRVHAAAVDFAKQVEPILVKRCSECHGPDQQKSQLRLDSRPSLLANAKSGKPAVVPGKASDSPLIARVESTDPDEVMPPKGARLTPGEVAALRQWIDAGAEWPAADPRDHWAFRSITHPQPPSVNNATWGLNDIDRFVLARLHQEGLEPRSEADRHTLIRRVSLDLTGLPPSWEETDRFAKDTSPEAYERLVDRLLASHHFGEQMARRWLDLARYADSNGYQVDLARSIWPYRDWVIDAFNRNQPFDQFTIEQLAGDLLPNPTPAQRIATGFNRNTKINDEGGGDAEEYRVKAVKDRVATLGTAWLGLTLNCAECHTHKYDPVSQEEYYRLFAYFNNTTDGGNYSTAPTLEVPKPDLTETRDYLQKRLDDQKRALAQAEQTLKTASAKADKQLAAGVRAWHTLAITNVVSTGGSDYTYLPDGSVLATGVNPIYDTITFESRTDLTGITGVLLEVLPDPSLPKNGPGRWSQTGNFILDEFAMAASPVSGRPSGDTNVVFAGATADWEQLYYRAEHAVDRNPKTGWAIGPRFGERHFLIARLKEPVGKSGGNNLSFRFEHYHGNAHCIGRFRVSVTTARDPEGVWPSSPELLEIARLKPAQRSDAQNTQLLAHLRAASPEIRQTEREILRIQNRLATLDAQKFSTLVMQERSEPEPRKTFIHQRGNFLDPGKAVTAGVPAVFPQPTADAPANRLTLARWLVDPSNPLTARVAANRLWEYCFGTGLVKTSEDFGRQGEPPSHPELLDWLASEFLRSGWDTKATLKKIVISATYRQDPTADRQRLDKDFYNRLFSRGPRFRMDAEMIRDHALAVSGMLDARLGGPSVYPVQIPNLWKEIGFLRPEIGMDEWPVSEGPDLYRRAVYTFWRRVCTYPTYATFDAPSRDVCVARRPRTNTPLQALAALNDPTLLEAARAFAQRILVEGGKSTADAVDFAFRTCLGRPPTDREHHRLVGYVDQQLKAFRKDSTAASLLIRTGSWPQSPEFEPHRVAAWMMAANVLFNLDETLTR